MARFHVDGHISCGFMFLGEISTANTFQSSEMTDDIKLETGDAKAAILKMDVTS